MKIPIKKKKYFRRHFQLLELMVAVFILLLCIAPAMRIFTSIYQSQQEIIRENLKDHLIHLTHAKFTEQLYKRMISFEDVKEKKDIVLDDPELIEQLEKSGFQCCGRFSIEKQRKPKGQDNPVEYLCKLEIQMKDGLARNSKQHSSSCQGCSPETYEYFIYIDTRGKEGDEDEEDDEEDDDEAGSEEEDEEEDDEDDDNDDEPETPGDKKPPMKAGPKNPEAKIAKGGLP